MAKKKYAIVKFLSSKDDENSIGYTYQNEIGAKKYDAVIVPTRYGISLAVVTCLTDNSNLTDHGYTYGVREIKEIAEVISSTEVAKVTTAAKKKDIKKKLEAEVKKLDDLSRFEMYATQSPEFAKLLKEYKSVA